LDNMTILSNSDAHSLNNIGREANVMSIDGPATYQKIYDNIKNKTGMEFTIEFYPEEGMYHLDGHRDCNFSCEPDESRKLNNICPKCGKRLVIGVSNRVNELADRPKGYRPQKAVGFKKLVELDKIIAEGLGVKSRNSVAVRKQYQWMINCFGPELEILLNFDLKKATITADSRIIEGIKRVRKGELIIKPGFDGQYGEISIFFEKDRASKQKVLFK